MNQKIHSFFSYSAKSVRFLWRGNRGYLIATIIRIVISAVSVFPKMYLINYSIDMLTKRVAFGEYLRIAGTIILVMLLLSAASVLIDNRIGFMKSRFYAKLRLEIDRICLDTDYASIQSKTFLENKGFALAAMDNDSLDLFIQSLHSLLSSLIVISGVLYIISQVSFVLLVPLVCALAIDLYNDYLNARQNFIDTKERVEYFRRSGYLQNISSDFAYAKEIRLFNLKERFKGRMDEVDQLLFALREHRRRQRRPLAIFAYGSDTVLDIAIYLYLGYRALVTADITLGRFSLYSNALRQLKSSVSDILFVMTQFVVNTEYLKGFFDFMSRKTGREDGVSPFGRPDRAEIRFENVSFRYPGSDAYTLKDVSITIDAGETLLIVGENGAGKSTFVKLLCGLYAPTKGRILLNGRDISTIPREEYISCISTVFQDYELFAMSISENVSALKTESPECPESLERVRSSLEQVGLLEKISAMPGAENTQLYRIFDESGVEFSGGEMQRLAIARAVYKDAPVLIMDEPASALDPKAEYEIYASFQAISEGRTSIYISHRLSGIKFSDRIAVFDKGRITEHGMHDELMAKNGLYAELYSMQASLYRQEAAQ